MRTRATLDRELLLAKYDFDTESGSIRFKVKIKNNNPGDKAGTIRTDGYVRLRIDGKARFAHRLIYFIATGKQPEYLDHINGNKSDNRISNLREATNSENMCNHHRRQLQGVYLRGRRWNGRVMKDYRTHRITPTEDREEAVRRLSELREKLHGDFVSC